MSDPTESREPPGPALDLERRAARGGVTVAVAQVARGLVEAVGVLVLSRALTPADFGLVDMIVSVTGIIDQLKDFGLGTALIQRPHIDERQINALFWISTAIGAGLTLVVAACAPLIAIGYERPELLQLTLALSLSTLLGALSLQQQALLKRALRFGALSVIDVVSGAAGIGAAIAGAYAHWGPWALVARQLVRLFVQAVMTWAWCSWRPSRPAGADQLGELLRFGGHMSGYQVLNYMERNLDNVLIGRFAGAQQLGFYAKAYELMRLPLTAINAPIATVAVPALSRLIDAPERYRKAYLSVTRLLLLVTVPLGPLMIFSADALIPLVLGEAWRGCVPILQVMALALFVKPLLFTTSWLFISQGRSADMFRWGMIGGVIALISFVVGLPWGAFGVAVSFTAFDLLLRAPILLWMTGRTGHVRVPDLLRCLVPAWTVALPMCAAYGAVSYGWHVDAKLKLAVGLPLSLAVGALVAWLTPWGNAALREGLAMLQALKKR
ncbi:MAG TPA: lipopolysaccharide biosynthesis protein [Polyangiales bacterium]|nr:lipopolysaccharide biosynthesis protein [Polyangiales bacterium]